MTKFKFLTAILFYGGNLFAQSIQLNDLIGVWKWGEGKNYNILTFKSDTIYSQNSVYKMNERSYRLDSLNNEYFLKTLPIGSESTPETVYKLGENNQGSFTLQLFKIRVFDKKTTTWRELEPHDKSIVPLIKEKDN